MKNILALILLSFISTPLALANGETLSIREEEKKNTANKKQMQEEGGQLDKSEKIYEENPRNPAFSESFERVGPDDQKKEIKE